jgi:hypothetical protein
MIGARVIFAAFGVLMLTAGTVAVVGGSMAGPAALGVGMLYCWLAVRR